MFEMYSYGDMSSDCTIRYDIRLDKSYTVYEFVQAVLKESLNVYGSISIYRKYKWIGDPIPVCRYDHDKILSTFPDDILNKKVVKAEATGGWRLMDYILYVE